MVYSSQLTAATTGVVVNVPLNGAAVFTIVFDPSTSSTMYVGSSNGVFKSTDSGNTWTPLNNFGLAAFPTSVHSRSIRQRRQRSMPAQSGSGALQNYKWRQQLDRDEQWHTGRRFSSAVNAIVIDPSNPSTIYAAMIFQVGRQVLARVRTVQVHGHRSITACRRMTRSGQWSETVRTLPHFMRQHVSLALSRRQMEELRGRMRMLDSGERSSRARGPSFRFNDSVCRSHCK